MQHGLDKSMLQHYCVAHVMKPHAPAIISGDTGRRNKSLETLGRELGTAEERQSPKVLAQRKTG